MSNGLYDFGREGFLGGDIDWDGDNIKCILVDTNDYTANLATHQYLSDVPATARVATSPNLTGKTITDGIADADDIAFGNVSGDESEALIYYQDTGVEGTSRLIAYVDTPASGLPVIPNGGAINVAHDNGANKIFKL